MQKRIVAFSSTPRKEGNSDILVDHVLKGAGELGAETEKIRLHDLAIRPCTACGVCQKSVETPCVIKDDMASLVEKIRQADGLLMASPIYFCSVNGQMKVFLDRLYALFGGGGFDTLRGKRAALVFTYGDKDPLSSGVMNALRLFQDAFYALGVQMTGWVQVSCLDAGEVRRNHHALEEARLLGRKLME